MFKRFLGKKKGVHTTEYILVIVVVLGAFVAFQKYIFRGIAGKWRGVGDSYGFGRQYDPKHTIECQYEEALTPGKWYDVQCLDARNCLTSNRACLEAGINACSSADCNR